MPHCFSRFAAFAWIIAIVAPVGCASVDHDFQHSIQQSHALFDAGNYEDALAGYETVVAKLRKDEERGERPLIEVRLGECHLKQGNAEAARQQFELVDQQVGAQQYELSTAQAITKSLGQAEAFCELGRRADPMLEKDSPLSQRERDQRRELARAHFEAALGPFSAARALRNDTVATIGLAYSWLRIGLLNDSTSAKRTARELVDQVAQQQDQGDPLLPFCQALLEIEVRGGRRLTPTAYEHLRDAITLDRQHGAFDFHELYRDVFARVRQYPTPAQLDGLSPEERQVAQSLIEDLRQYLLCGSVPNPNWTAWTQLRSQLTAYFERYDEWVRRERDLEDRIEQASRLVYEQGKDGYLDALAQGLELLEAKPAPDSRQLERYRATRRDVQELYVEALVRRARLQIANRFWTEAKKNLTRALNFSDREFVSNHQTYIQECQEKLGLIAEHEKFANVRGAVLDKLSQAGKEAAVAELDRAVHTLDQVMLTQELEALRNTISKEQDLQRFHQLMEDAIAARAASKLENAALKFGEAAALCRAAGLVEEASRAVREQAQAHYESNSPRPAIAVLSTIELSRPQDKVLEGLCHYKNEDFAKAGEAFATAGLEAVKAWSGSDPALKFAGTSLLRAGQLSRAQQFLEAALAEYDQPEIQEALVTCYRRRLEVADIVESEERTLREKLLAVDPDDWESVRRLAFLLYARGPNDEAAYRRAYELLCRYTGSRSAAPLDLKESKTFAKLVAAYADFAPLRVDEEWRYRTPSARSFRHRVVAQDGDNYDVELLSDSSPEVQEWLKLAQNKELRRRRPAQDTSDFLPIGLRTPEQDPLPRQVKRDRYGTLTAEVVAIGETTTAAGLPFENCLRVRTYRTPLGETENRTAWQEEYYLAPGIGVVRYANQLTGESYELDGSTLLERGT
ncbi:MAG: hypothetical protein AB7O52_11215 [Planctomycetota bacterium]